MRALVMVMLLSGCVSTAAGDWSGICRFSSEQFEVEMDVYAEIWSNNGRSLEGTITVIDWEDTSRTGDLFGDQTGRYVSLTGRFLSSEGEHQLDAEGARVGNQIDGDCAFRVPEGSGALLGELKLSR